MPDSSVMTEVDSRLAKVRVYVVFLGYPPDSCKAYEGTGPTCRTAMLHRWSEKARSPVVVLSLRGFQSQHCKV